MRPANWWNRVRYRIYAPVYDRVASPLKRGRERAIDRLDLGADDRILILGCGPGVDLEYLPTDATIVALDITPAMVERTATRAEALGLDVDARVGDAGSLPFEDDSFDAVLLHLVLSVVLDPGAVVAETARVLAPDGRVSVYDKFVPEGTDPSLPRRVANPLARFLFSDLNRRLEPMVAGTGLELGPREAFLGGLYTVTVARPVTDGTNAPDRQRVESPREEPR
jgi:ubiquinone/menaquinone biosynthesis C-methylase UbiE